MPPKRLEIRPTPTPASAHARRTPPWSIAALPLLIAVTEGAIMAFVGRDLPIPWQAYLKVIALDAGVLALVLSLFVYFLFLRPHQRMEEQYAGLLESAPDPIVSLDAEGKVVYANPRALDAFGYTAEKAGGMGFLEFVSPEGLPPAQEIFDRARRGVPTLGVELPLRSKDGTAVPFEVSAIPTFSRGAFRGGVAILRDIRGRKEAERLLRRRLDVERSVSRVSARFVGTVDVERAIEESLGDVGRMSTASRAYLCLLQPEAGTAARILEWCPAGMVLPDTVRGAFNLAHFPWLHDRLRRDGMVRVDDIAALPPEAASERAEFERRGVHSTLMLALPVAGELSGFLGLDLLGAAEPWNDEDVALLRVLAEIVGRALAQARADRAVRESEEQFRALFEHAHDLIQSVAPDGSFLFVNPAWLRATGYTREELRSLTIHDVLDPRVREKCRAVFEKVAAGEDQKCDGVALLAKGGSSVEVEGSATALRKEGRVTAVFGIFRDVTERRRMEERVFRVQQDWKDAFDTLTDMITVHDADFRIIQANKSAERLLGLPLLDASAVRCYEYYHGTACPPEGCPSCRTLKSGEPTVQEIYEPHLGRFLEIRAIPRFDRERRVVGLIHVVRDITESKRAEEALRESERQYRLLFEGNPLPMLVYDAGTLGILAVNEAAIRKYGYPREEFLGRAVAELRFPEDAPAFRRKAGSPPGGLEHIGIWRHRKQDGSLLYADITCAIIPFDGKEAVLVLAVDVTEQKQLEQQLRHAQKMEAIGQLAGGVAHDFNNLLSVIVMYASLLREQEPLSPTQADYLDQILASSERAANLTRSLLVFSRKQTFHLAPLDLNEAVRRLASLLQRVLGEEIRLHVRTAERPLVILADGGQVEQVIMNLCTNARDAMPRGGTLTLTVGAVEMDEAFLGARGFGKAGSYALFSVEDTGSGMDEKTRVRVFEPFFTTKETGKGTGLGLAIVYGIVKQHQGFIGVTSRVGEGTVFEIYLPLPDHAVAVEGSAVPARPRGGQETILLAEDEDAVRRITRTVLEESGYTVVEARDGADAIRQFHAVKGLARLFLTDVIMPKMNGREAYEQMLLLDPALRVLFTSGYTADFLEQRGIESGAINFLPKPASPSDLLRKVREVLDA